jgi:hypothetical protein
MNIFDEWDGKSPYLEMVAQRQAAAGENLFQQGKDFSPPPLFVLDDSVKSS